MSSLGSLSVKELKQRLVDRGISTIGLLEKQDLVFALQQAETPSESSSAAAIERMSTSELKDLIRHLAGRTTGLFERVDLVRRVKELLNTSPCAICLDTLACKEPLLVFVACCPLAKGVYHAQCLQTFVLKSAEDGRWPVPCVGCGKALDEFIVKHKIFRNKELHHKIYTNIVDKLKELREQRASQDLRLDPALYRQCPRCKTWIEKGPSKEIFGIEIPGCDKMTCRCGHQFCFRCGADKGRCHCTGAEHDFFSHHDVITDYPGAKIL